MATTQPDRSDEPGLLSKALKVLSFPFAAAAGYWFGSTHISDAAYDRLKRHYHELKNTEEWKKLEKSEQDRLEALFESKDLEALKAAEATLPEVRAALGNREQVAVALREELLQYARTGSAEFTSKVAPLDKAITADVRAGLKAMGLGSFKKQWEFAHKSTRQRALMEAFTAAGITLGAMFAVASSRTISHAFARREKENDEGRSA